MNDLNGLDARAELVIREPKKYIELFVMRMSVFPISFQKFNIALYVFTNKTDPIFSK